MTAGTGSTRAGGLTAQNNGSILRSYATGAVSGGNQGVGGLVGFNRPRRRRAGRHTSSIPRIATGAVTATSFGGGLVGINSVGASIDNSYAAGAVSVTSSTIATLFRRGTDRQQLRSRHPVLCDRGRRRYVHVCSGHGHVGGRADRQQRQHGYAHTVLRDRCGQRRLGCRASTTGGLIGRNVGGATVIQSYATGAASATSTAGSAMAGGLIGSHGSTGTVTQTYATGTASAVSTSGTAVAGGLIGSVTGTGGRHVVLLGHRYVREGECRRQRRQHRHHRSHHQPDAESGKLCVNLRGLGFRHRLVGAERRLLPAALWRQLRAAGRSCQRVAGLWRRQPGIHLFDLRFSCRRYGRDRQRPLGIDGGDDDFECRHLRDQRKWRQCRQRLRTGLSLYRCTGHADRHAAFDHRRRRMPGAAPMAMPIRR